MCSNQAQAPVRRLVNTVVVAHANYSRSMSCVDKYMEDAQEFYHAYKTQGGECGLDDFKKLLRAFFEHTLNSHVWGECAETSQKDKNGFWLHPSPDDQPGRRRLVGLRQSSAACLMLWIVSMPKLGGLCDGRDGWV